MNQSDPNKQNQSEDKTQLAPFQKRHLMEQYKKLLSLVPHGKHKNQRGTKGAFGKPKNKIAK